jgi:hypothetical protein
MRAIDFVPLADIYPTTYAAVRVQSLPPPEVDWRLLTDEENWVFYDVRV